MISPEKRETIIVNNELTNITFLSLSHKFFFVLIFFVLILSSPQFMHFCQAASGGDFTNIQLAAFLQADPESTKKTDNLTVFLRFWDLRT